LNPEIIQEGPFKGLKRNSYSVLYADPAWSFKSYSRKDISKMPDAHYDCMSLDDIKNLPVRDLAAQDSVCVVWCTAPMIKQGLETLEAWGFEFKTMGAWAKQSSTGKAWGFGTGYIYRSAMEPWILGTKGKPKSLSKSIRNLIVAPIREHSRKPDQMIEMIEAQFEGPYCELFCRQARAGWDSWGNQVDRFKALPWPDPGH